jgi:hypothetical protein
MPFTSGGMALFLRSKNCDSPLSGATVGYTPINNPLNRRGPIITQRDAAGIAARADSAGFQADRTEALLCRLFHFFCRRLPVPMLIYQRWQPLDLSSVCITGMLLTSAAKPCLVQQLVGQQTLRYLSPPSIKITVLVKTCRNHPLHPLIENLLTNRCWHC